jgi:hypothetical protein
VSTQDGVAVVTAVVAVVALVVSVVTAVLNRRDVAAAGVAAAEARTVAERHARAAEDAARSAALTAEAMRAMADELRRRRTRTLLAPVRDGPPLALERRRGQTYALVNRGAVQLTGLTLETDHPPELTRNLPTAETLEPGDAVVFLLAASAHAPLPPTVLVRADQLPEGLPLALPGPD